MADLPDLQLPAVRPPVSQTLLLWLAIGVAGTVLFPLIYTILGAVRPGYDAFRYTIWSIVLVIYLWTHRSISI